VEQRLFTVDEAAEFLKVHPESVRRWLRDGKLHGHRVTRRAGWRIPEAELRKFAMGTEDGGKLAA
jgi:excisionase family DNA binding protein